MMLATPATADHTADIAADGSRCRMGGMATGMHVDLWTDDVARLTTKAGKTTGFVCHFRDIPDVIDGGSPDEPLWVRPDQAWILRGVTCLAPETDLAVHYWDAGLFIMTPSGRATLTCKM